MKATEEYLSDNFIVKNRFESISDNTEAPKNSLQCEIENMKVWMSPNRILVEGSLWKYYLGSNDGDFTNEQIYKAYEKLQFSVPTINWKLAKFSKLHFGPNFIVSQSPDKYSLCFEGKKGKKKTVIVDKSITVNIGYESNQTVIYNKSAEKHDDCNEHILRIEHRIDSSYWRKKYFGTSYPTVETLLSKLDLLHEIWYAEYESIEKNYHPKFPNVSSISGLKDIALYDLGYDTCKNILRESYKSGTLSKPSYDHSKRVISHLQKSGKQYTSDSNLMAELDALTSTHIQKIRSNQ